MENYYIYRLYQYLNINNFIYLFRVQEKQFNKSFVITETNTQKLEEQPILFLDLTS